MGNVILIGFMGCGKSSVAVKLSYRLKQAMTDTDSLIEKRQGKTIAEIFAQDGEDAFRKMETEVLMGLKETAKNQVISVGGGVPVREENRILMKEIGKVVYLRAKPETLYERVKDDTGRPLLQCSDPQEKIRTLLEERKEAYEAAADLIVDVDDKNFGQILYEIERGTRQAPRIPRLGYGFKEGAARAAFETKEGYFAKPGEEYPASERESYGHAGFGKQEGYLRSTFGRREGLGYQGYRKDAAFGRREEGQQCPVARTALQGAGDKPQYLKKLLVINGPNLNFLGIREKEVYGTQDYKYLLDLIARKGIACRAFVDVFQSNHEGAIIDRIQAAYFDGTEGIVINPGAYTHYSYAIRDALASITVPKVEVHISNIMEREEFRHVSVTAPACDKQIYGHGLDGYLEAIDFILVNEKNHK